MVTGKIHLWVSVLNRPWSCYSHETFPLRGELLLPFALPGKRSYQERLSNQFELSSLSQLSFLQDSRNWGIDFNMQQHSTSRMDIFIVFATRWPGSKFQFQEPLVLETKRVENYNWGVQVCELNQFGLFLRTWIKLSPGIESVHENITLVSKHNEWCINKSVSQQWCSNAR